MIQTIPVITIDGPSGSGKGTLSQLLAEKLGWHWLDSGALYRLLALDAEQQAISLDDISQLVARALQLDVEFIAGTHEVAPRIFLNKQEVTNEVRLETTGRNASKISAYPEVRAALLDRQRAFRQAPGLVTDGRDMGTVVFPDAMLKIFLTASLEERAKRRHLQLLEQGIDVTLRSLIDQLAERDQRDQARAAAPMRPAEDAINFDTTDCSIDEMVQRAWEMIESKKRV